MKLSAYAKINWTLDIIGTDEKGYHLLDMLMESVSLCDSVEVIKQKSGIALEGDSASLGQENICFKAAELFFKASGINEGCKITLKKNIPAGAGLGGGSADAAAVLKALNSLFDGPICEKVLADIAPRLGADVPFMLKNGFARAGGIGEKLEMLKKQKHTLLLVTDTRFPASTREVYQAFDRVHTKKRPNNDRFLSALLKNDFDLMNFYGGNALQDAAISVVGGIKENLNKMQKLSEFASMSGSGSTVFGVFENEKAARSAQCEFENMWTAICTTL